MSSAVFHWSGPVRFSDTDAMGHVNNARYLAYLEEARIAFLASLQPSMTLASFILARTEIDHLRPVFLTANPVEVDVDVRAVGRSSFTLGSRVHHEGAEVARAITVLVAYDYGSHTSRPLADDERVALSAWLRADG